MSGLDELSELVKRSFPGLTCLRCGNEQFALFSGSSAELPETNQLRYVELADEHPVTTLICTRCGYIERHATSFLRWSEKPIVEADGSG